MWVQFYSFMRVRSYTITVGPIYEVEDLRPLLNSSQDLLGVSGYMYTAHWFLRNPVTGSTETPKNWKIPDFVMDL